MSTSTRAFAEKYGPWALIAGGSEGIGKSFALQLAAQGLHLILVARTAAALQDTAEEIRGRYPVQVVTAALNLTSVDLEQKLDTVIAGKEVGLLVYNAGATHGAGLLLDQPLDRALNLVRLNCVGPLTLVHKLGQGMKQRGRGGVILMGSMAGFAGMGYAAAYAATKSFDMVLAEGLWFELGLVGVDVLGLVAGATETPAMQRSGMKFGQAGADIKATGPADTGAPTPNLVPMEPDDVAREALEHLGKGPVWIAGARNREAAGGLRNAPREQVVRAMSAATAQLYGLSPPQAR